MFEQTIEARTPVLQITSSERAELQRLAERKAKHEITDHFRVSETGADLTALFARMGVAGPTEAVAAAFRRGLINPE